MAARARRSGRWILMVGLLLVGAAAWFLLGGGDDAADGLASPTEPKDEQVDAVMRTADGQGATGPASRGPVLVGHTAEPKPPVARTNVTVTVVGLGARPLVGVRVELVSIASMTDVVTPVKQWGEADAHGEVVFADVALDGLSAARVGGDADGGHTLTVRPDGQAGSILIVLGSTTTSWTPIRQARVTLTVDRGIPLRIAPRGRPGVAASSLAVMGLTHRFPGAEKTGLRTDGEEPVLALGPGDSFLLQYRLRREEDGEGAMTSSSHPGRVHPQATRLVAHEPMPVDARVVVLIEDLPVELRGVPIHWLWSWQHVRWQLARSEADADDRHHLRGIPHLGGEIVKVAGAIGSHAIRGEGILPWRADQPLVIRATLLRGESGGVNANALLKLRAAYLELSKNDVLRSKRAADSALVDSLIIVDASAFVFNKTFKPLLPIKLAIYGEVVKRAASRKPAVFRIRCFQPNGEPAVGATVSLFGGVVPTSAPPAGADGVVRFENLTPGQHAVQVWGAGVPRNVPFDVPPSQTGTFDVRGTVGGTIDVEVLDADGRPLPFARLAMEHPSGQLWVDLDGSTPKGAEVVQRIDPYVGADGRRRLHGVEPGLVTVRATFGTRSAFVRVQVLDGRTHSARLVLPVLTLKSGPKAKAAGPQIVGPDDAR